MGVRKSTRRFETYADMARGLLDDAGGGEMRDKGALPLGRDRVAARCDVRDGGEGEGAAKPHTQHKNKTYIPRQSS